MTHDLFTSVDRERTDDGHRPSRRLIRVALLAMIVALVVFMVVGPASVEYTMAAPTHHLDESGT